MAGPPNFGPVHNGLVDYRWNEAAGSRWNGPAYTYDPTYVRPTTRTAHFDGCPTQDEADAGNSTTNTYTWSVLDPANDNLIGTPAVQRNCQWSRVFDLDPTTGRAAPVKVRLSVTKPDGSTLAGYPQEQLVEVKDILIVSLGDSYGSGEGAPDVPQVINSLGFVEREARWVDKRCHRSAAAPSAVAARQIEAADPHSTVTFLSFACSGATISQPYFNDSPKLDPYGLPPAGGFQQPQGSGILGPYRGIEPPNPDDWSVAGMLPSQVDQLRNALTNGGTAPARNVDALTLSGGGNDMGFGPVASVCTLYGDCENHFVMGANAEGPRRLTQRFDQSVATMPGRYSALQQALDNLPITETYITQYPDPSRNDTGAPCSAILDDVIPPWMSGPLAAVALLESQPAPLPFYQMEGNEVVWAGGHVFSSINGAVGNAAAAHTWTLVDGIADTSANLFSGHGYCASDNWIRTATEAVAMQGPWDPPAICNVALLILQPLVFLAACAPPATAETKGTLHPTHRGYQAIAGRLVEKLRPDLLPPPPSSGTPPAPTFTEARSGATAGADGWLTGPAAGVLVQLTASVPSSTSLQGVSLTVNGSPVACSASGTTTGPITCRAETTSPQTNVWSLTFTGDGIYSIAATATARNGTRTDDTFEFKVDLTDPTSATATPSSATAPSSGWYRTPVDVQLGGLDVPGGSGIQSVEYALDGGPVQTVPSGTSIRLETDGTHTFSALRPVDQAGRRGAVQPDLTVRVDQAAPSVNCGSADGRWHAADVTIGCTASDGGSGLASSTDSSFSLTTSVASGSETAAAATDSRSVCDVAGNCTTAGPVKGNQVDKKAPTVAISAPTTTRYVLGTGVNAAYSCGDGGSGLVSCSGPVPPGTALDTSSVGARTFTVNAADNAGNTSSGSVSYEVGFGVCLMSDPDRPNNGGSNVSVRLQLCDAAGANRSTAELTPTATGVFNTTTGQSVPLQSPGNSQPGDRFTFDDGAYLFNVRTNGYPPGRYELSFTVPGDTATYVARFTVR